MRRVARSRGGQLTINASEEARAHITQPATEGRYSLEPATEKKCGDIEHVYFNATLTNSTAVPMKAEYRSTRDDPIMDDPNVWEMSVVRFDVSASLIPLCVLPLIAGTNTYDIGIVSIVLVASNSIFSSTVTWTDYNLTELGLPRGSIMTYQQFLHDINNALAAAYALIPVIDRPAGSQAPQFIWNPVTAEIDLWVDPSYVGLAAPLVIDVSQQIQPYLSGFIYIYVGAAYQKYSLVIHDEQALVQPAAGARIGLPLSVSAAPATLYRVPQQAPVSGTWNGVRSVYITSYMLPIIPEYITTNPANDGDTISTGSERIISDFLLTPEDNPLSGRTVFEYLPTAEYRVLDLKSGAPLYSIDLNLYWVDFAGNSYPVLLKPGSTFSAKILFRKRGVCCR